MPRDMYPQDYINEVLIEEIKDIVPGKDHKGHAYLAFFLICAGIEFLGICLDDSADWFDKNKSASHFQNAMETLFPARYGVLKQSLYNNLRCGLLHANLPNGYSLTELRNDPKKVLTYDGHLENGNTWIMAEYFYQDFVNACNKVATMSFSDKSKMKRPLLTVPK